MIRRVGNSKAAKEVRRAVPPWGVIVIAAVIMGLAVACLASAFNG